MFDVVSIPDLGHSNGDAIVDFLCDQIQGFLKYLGCTDSRNLHTVRPEPLRHPEKTFRFVVSAHILEGFLAEGGVSLPKAPSLLHFYPSLRILTTVFRPQKRPILFPKEETI